MKIFIHASFIPGSVGLKCRVPEEFQKIYKMRRGAMMIQIELLLVIKVGKQSTFFTSGGTTRKSQSDDVDDE
jgi:hypothetical protein